MPRKNIILTIVIVVLFAATGFIIYYAFFAQPTPPPSSAVISGSATPAVSAHAPAVAAHAATNADTDTGPAPSTVSSAKILPLGATLDLTGIKKYNPNGQLFSYPQVAPAELNPGLSNLVKKNP